MEEAHNTIQYHEICIRFYKESLRQAEREIETNHETGKALKDIIGLAYETHRKRLWEYFGFKVSKERHGAMFNVDWSITYMGVLIAFEETKGHYVDSCFLERVLSGFCKTVNIYNIKGKHVPVLILHSFTRYNKYSEKLEEDMDTRTTEIGDEIRKKIVYTTLVECDRLSKKKWFSKDFYESYSNNASDELILTDIKFIRSLIPVSE
tara:strand:- start:1141 stop:1761 length:621 start_codon:yes stop_codon:yes gene_type:complete